MFKKNKTQTTCFALIFLVFISFSLPAQAIGLMSKPVEINNALRGQTVKEELKISNSNKKRSSFALLAEGDIKEWVRFFYNQVETRELEIDGESKEIVEVEIKLPNNLPNGEYSGSLVVEYNPQGTTSEKVSVAIAQRVSRQVAIKVTDQEIVKLSASVSPKNYVIMKGEPLEIKAQYHNQGNILLKPNLQVKIIKDGKIIDNFIYPYPESRAAITPLEQEEVKLFYNFSQSSLGKYHADITVLLQGKEIKKENFAFAVVESEKSWGLFLGQYWYWLIVLGILLITFSLVVLYKKNLKQT